MKRTISIYVCLLAALSFCACGNSGDVSSGKQEPIGVKVISVTSRSDVRTAGYVGTVDASRKTVLSSRYPGTLVSMKVSQGDYVRKGELVAEIYSQTVVSAYEMAQATLAQAEDGYRRAQQVYDSGSIADVKMVEIRTQLQKARSAADAAKRSLEDCRIKAPYSGCIGEVFAEEGVEVSAMEPLVRLMDVSSIEIRIPIPENEYGEIAPGQEALVDIPALSVTGMKARIASKGLAASPLSHSYDCTLHPEDSVSGLMPGMVCKVYLKSNISCGFVLPSRAVKTDMDGRYVWVVRDGRVCRTTVKIDGFSGNGVVVSEGLEEGDKVITEGMQKVSSGMTVKIEE